VRKLTPIEHMFLGLVANAGGSFCPDESTSADAHRALRELVKAKRLSTEETDTGYRYHLTTQGWTDAS
jgi:hypothetical protein